MLTKERILTVLKTNRPVLEREMGVKRIGLFGSYAKDKQTYDSDVDIYIELDDYNYRKILKVLLFLENQFGVKVDLVYNKEKMRSSFVQTLERETIYA